MGGQLPGPISREAKGGNVDDSGASKWSTQHRQHREGQWDVRNRRNGGFG